MIGKVEISLTRAGFPHKVTEPIPMFRVSTDTMYANLNLIGLLLSLPSCGGS